MGSHRHYSRSENNNLSRYVEIRRRNKVHLWDASNWFYRECLEYVWHFKYKDLPPTCWLNYLFWSSGGYRRTTNYASMEMDEFANYKNRNPYKAVNKNQPASIQKLEAKPGKKNQYIDKRYKPGDTYEYATKVVYVNGSTSHFSPLTKAVLSSSGKR